MTGTASQVEWAERIRQRVGEEFARVARSLESAASSQTESGRITTAAILRILEDKRATVMSRQEAGYFIHDWQEISDQVRKLILQDARFEVIRARRKQSQMEIKNMNIRPLYDRIVVKRTEEHEATRNGIIIPDSAREKPQEGEVIAVGRGKQQEDGNMTSLDVKAGDRVLFAKYSGSETTVDGTEYIIMREDDVLGVLDTPSSLAKVGQV